MTKRRNPWILLIVLASLTGASCDSKPQPSTAATTETITRAVNKPPVTYAGPIPCADCPGIQYTLTLWPEGIASQRSTYLEAEVGKNLSFVELMTWRRIEGGRQLLLEGDRERAQRFATSNGHVLSMLDARGKPIESGLNYDLARADNAAPVQGPLNLRGYYRYTAHAATFKECGTGKRFPVSQKANDASLRRAYSKAITTAGAPLFVTLHARLTLTPNNKGQRTLTIVPKRFASMQVDGNRTGAWRRTCRFPGIYPSRLSSDERAVASRRRERSR